MKDTERVTDLLDMYAEAIRNTEAERNGDRDYMYAAKQEESRLRNRLEMVLSRPDADTVRVPRAEIEAVIAGCIWDEDARPVIARWLGEEEEKVNE